MLGTLLARPTLLGATLSLSPASGRLHIRIHSAFDGSVSGLSGADARPFTPTLQYFIPAGATLMLDTRLLRVFHGESAVAPVPPSGAGGDPSLLVVARVTDEASARATLASVQTPLSQLFAGTATAPVRHPSSPTSRSGPTRSTSWRSRPGSGSITASPTASRSCRRAGLRSSPSCAVRPR
jgi:hypothetical protein